uniref:SF3 helicase domain-containing protein n=1 Tax=viral metagenome TaxID=1070528 RepID=A0A6C0JQK6_9ZZZZ
MSSEDLAKLLLISETKGNIFNFQTKVKACKYNVQNIEEMWKIYDKLYLEDKLENQYLMESPIKEYSIFRLDIDIKPKANGESNVKRLYITEDVKKLHLVIVETLKACISNLNIINDWEHCYVFEKDNWIDKDGFHLMYPNLFITHESQSTIVSQLNENLEDIKYFSNKNFLIDNIVNKPWVVLGSKKDIKSNIYKLTKLFDSNGNLMMNTKMTKPSDFSIKKRSDTVFGTIRREQTKSSESRNQNDIDRDYEIITEHKILENLSPSRYINYDEWVQIGIVLYNIGSGSDKFLELWCYFSSKNEIFDENETKKKWNTFYIGDSTIRSLFYYLYEDNLDYYNKLQSKNIYKQIPNLMNFERFSEDSLAHMELEKEILDGIAYTGDFRLAEIFYDKYENEYTWEPETKKWYYFDGVRWVECGEERIIFNIHLMSKPIEIAYLSFVNKMIERDGKTEKSKYAIKNLANLKRKLNSVTKTGLIEKTCRLNFSNRSFFKLKNANKHLIGCKNGVLDLENNVFRRSKPEDFITMSTNINYCESPKEEDLKELEDYYSTLFPDEKVRKNFIELMATSSLKGSNDDKNIIFALGETNTGKSQLVKLYEKTFGDYLCVLPKEIMYERNSVSSSSARPELADTEGARLAVVNELSNKENMSVATLKELSGNDRVYNRGLYKHAKKFENMFTMYVSCNFIPKIPQDDEAMWDRILIVNFASKFRSKNIPTDKEEQKKKRIFSKVANLDNKFKRLASTHLYYLFQVWKDISVNHPNGVPICDQIKKDTKQYRSKNNVVRKYIDECIAYEEGDGNFMSVKNLFNNFGNWFKNSYKSQKLSIDKDDFEAEFTKFSRIPLTYEEKPGKGKKQQGWENIIIDLKNENYE